MQVEAWLQRAACLAPQLTALETPDAQVSYADLLGAARAGAGELAARGVRPGERVAIALEPGIDFAQALHACFLLGAVAVPVDLRLSSSERDPIVAGTSALIEQPLLPAAKDQGDSQTFASDATHDLDAVCAVIHTSGTTSAPKPVELTYGNFLWSAIGSGVALGVDPGERWLCALPLSHVGGLSILVRSAIYATTAYIHERFDTERVLCALEEQRITLISLVSTTLARLLDAGLHSPPHLRCALTGGGPVPAALVRRARDAHVPVIETYGLTECCSQAATAPLGLVSSRGVDVGGAKEDSSAGIPRSVGAGVPLFCTRTQIADDGEILLCGPTVARSALAPDGRLHTGDLGQIDADGFLHVSGRKADTIVSGGENVAPSEVEAVLETHPEVLEAAVVAREDPHWGEAVTAIVVLAGQVGQAAQVGQVGQMGQMGQMEQTGRPEQMGEVERASVDEGALREYCSSRLAPFKVPKRVEFVTTPLPRTRSGKLLRRGL